STLLVVSSVSTWLVLSELLAVPVGSSPASREPVFDVSSSASESVVLDGLPEASLPRVNTELGVESTSEPVEASAWPASPSSVSMGQLNSSTHVGGFKHPEQISAVAT